jgi:sugar phosphate permease
MVFVNIGYVTWMPTFYFEKFHLSLASAGFSSMFFHFALAFAGVLVGGRLSDWWALTNKKARLFVELIGLLGGVPFIFIMGHTNGLYISYAALAAFGFFRGLYDSNLFAALFDVVEPEFRATAVGLMTSFAFIVGAFSPVILGWIKTRYGLSAGISSLSICYLLSAIAILLAARYFFTGDYFYEKQELEQ